ncbi:MAG: OmpA family protein [Gammaproteobacteria bacterium]|nr:OmpA family protein [Gammaproteobacteria bacterium]
MSIKSNLLPILLLCVCTNAQALERQYLASMEASTWTLTENSLIRCRIEHQIPRFGVAVFSQEAGRALQLELRSKHKFSKGINVELRSETTGWKEKKTRTVLARFETSGARRLFKIPTTVAEKTYYELSQGYQPGFLFYDDYPLMASLSTVRFGQVEGVFAECVNQLYGYNFNDVRISSIYFDPDDEFASIRQEETAFAKMMNYLSIDNAVSEIVVTGHTDRTGPACYNEGLSERRAWYVYDLLIARGIDSELLRVDYLGEAYPVRKGGSKASLAANRRVTVELRR